MEGIYQALIGLAVAAITALAGYVGVTLKRIFEEKVNTKIKRDVARTVVRAVEQLYKDLNGDEKYLKAVEALAQMLAEKGIPIGELEIRMLIEAAVNEFHNSFNFFEEEAILDKLSDA